MQLTQLNKKKKTLYADIQKRLLRWFDQNRRDLPWRRNQTPYHVYISEIMLQQTQVQTVLPYYYRWMERFPDFRSVAEASEEEVLKHWEGLGYYSRARNIHKVALMIVERHHGRLPGDHASVLALPGIGPYTAGAIMSLAFNEDYPLVDGNVERVFARLFDIDSPVKDGKTRKIIWNLAKSLLPSGKARRFNEALMDLGATVCLPRNWRCGVCPLGTLCESNRIGVVELRPVRGMKKPLQSIQVAIGILIRNGQVFIQKRPRDGLMGHLWEFPGGKIEEGEAPEEALIREFTEELGVAISAIDKVGVFKHSYTMFKVSLHAFLCELEDTAAEPIATAAVDSKWVDPHQLDHYAFPAANRRLIDLLV